MWHPKQVSKLEIAEPMVGASGQTGSKANVLSLHSVGLAAVRLQPAISLWLGHEFTTNSVHRAIPAARTELQV